MGNRTVGIIGTGWVGSSVAIAILQAGVAEQLWLYDTRSAVAEGEAMDLAHGAAFYPACTVRAVDELAQMREAQIVIVAAGRGSQPGETRLALLRDNARLVADIGRLLAGFAGIVVLVTNPVDVLTAVLAAASGLPPERVLGTGTLLDTARLRQMLSQQLALAPSAIHAQVVGEHGDSEVVLWSGAQVGGLPLRQWPGWRTADETPLATAVREAANQVIQRKGCTNHAIGLVTAELVRTLLGRERRVLTVSRMQTGAFGLQGLALSLPTLVGPEGATTIIETAMDAAEAAALQRSASIVKTALATVA